MTPFYAEFAGYRQNDRQQGIEILKIAGPQAVDDYLRVVQVWAQQAPSED